MKKALLWFQQDLRLHDNLLLDWVTHNPCEALAVWFVPENLTPQQKWFQVQSALLLKDSLQKQGLPFYLLMGPPDEGIPALTAHFQIEVLLTQTSFNYRDDNVLEAVSAGLKNIEILNLPQQTLIYPADLPFAIADMPEVFSKFRRLVEKNWKIRPTVATEAGKYQALAAELPSDLKQFQPKDLTPAQLPYGFQPGEAAALLHLKEYIWDQKAIQHYKLTRNGMIEKSDSSKISIWLSNGTLSVRRVYEEIKDFESQHGENESTQWLIMELLWRDYFKFLSLKIGEKIFLVNGLDNSDRKWRKDAKVFQQWKSGYTGSAFVDANMIELNLTGWMSNRGRQNVASFLAKTLNIDWTLGAAYFESQLLDYDAESNWGNWLYLSGQGTDPRDRVFNVEKQAEFYDSQGEYQKLWLSKPRNSNSGNGPA